jgi:serine protease Do
MVLGIRGRLSTPFLGWLLAFFAVSVIAGASAGAVVALILSSDDGSSSAAAGQGARGASREVVAEVAAFAMPAVVTIIIEGPARVDEQGNVYESVNSGSGVIVDAAGYIVTNEHVVREPGTLTVVLSNGEQRPARIVSHDAPFTDLAVLQIPSGGLRALPLGDSNNLVPGQTVLAIGSALFEYSSSVSVGVVSGLGRRYLREGIYMEDLIQTDAAVNVGNSGGPLVNLNGEVVGLVSNVVRRIGPIETVQGISFAISSRTMLPIVSSIVRNGSFPRPYFGVEHADLDLFVAQQLGVNASRGALVRRVFANSPASRAGIRAGDIILKMGNYDIDEEFMFLNALSRQGVNERVAVQVQRGGEMLEISLQLVPR